jgi:hypothetical protein
MSPSLADTADLSALRCTVPVFQLARDLDPIPIGSWDHLPAAAEREVPLRLATAGFAIVAADQTPDLDAPQQLADALGLGPVFVPPQYSDRLYVNGQGVTRIGADAATASHPAFGQTTGQRLHSDGTLQRIGEVKTAMLLCARPARSGGASQLFNSTGAFAQLLHEDPAAAATLTAPDVLVRTSTLAHSRGQRSVGPAFAVAEERLISRYSVTDTDSYDPAAVTDPAALQRALEFLQQAAQPPSPHYTEFTLTAGQGLLLANDLISHGRAAYHDDPAHPRMMLRALFARLRPAVKQAA